MLRCLYCCLLGLLFTCIHATDLSRRSSLIGAWWVLIIVQGLWLVRDGCWSLYMAHVKNNYYVEDKVCCQWWTMYASIKQVMHKDVIVNGMESRLYRIRNMWVQTPLRLHRQITIFRVPPQRAHYVVPPGVATRLLGSRGTALQLSQRYCEYSVTGCT